MNYNPKKTPIECNDMTEIRLEIDHLDESIISLIGTRYGYVKAAAKFKKNVADVKAPERFKAMLRERRLWASENGLNPDVIEKIYTDLVSYFISEEMQHWKKRS
ncbi:isochorismate lyase [Mucilaginibacter sp. UYCu711]|uniref:isochorismate lyase n=1 Tax=Mucilaginibacter sp. UYCu711 TaxID=3156339 RepID=UPI003D263BE9